MQSREETVFSMLAEIREAAARLKFLMDYTLLPEDDIKLNSQTFNWPARMEPIFAVSQQHLTSSREVAEDQIKTRRSEFEMKLEEYQVQVDSFREKEVPRQVEDIGLVIVQLDEFTAALEAAKEQAMVRIQFVMAKILQGRAKPRHLHFSIHNIF